MLKLSFLLLPAGLRLGLGRLAGGFLSVAAVLPMTSATAEVAGRVGIVGGRSYEYRTC